MNLGISALEYVRQVGAGQLSAEEFMACTLERIKKHDELGAYISTDESCINMARAVDKKIRTGQKVGACLGMPVSVKDNICIRGAKTTCASRMLQDYVAPYDATAIQRLRKKDAIFVGKTNLDEFAMGFTTEFSSYGPSRNPWNQEYVPGGSSGGSAVAVAANQCIVSLGSDTGGSVRNPASFCGVVGFKPTYGTVSRYGLVSYANSIEQIGPITRTVGDAAFVMNIISGYDPHDNTTLQNDTDYLDGIDAGIEGKKIGIVREMTAGMEEPVAKAMSDAVSTIEELGASCVDMSIDMMQYAVASYYTITSTEAASNLARYDNLRYGFDMPMDGYEFNTYISRARGRFGPEVIRRMILGGLVPSAGHAGRYFLKALKVKARLARQIKRAFETVDLLLTPTVPVMPFKIGSRLDDPVSLFAVDVNTVTANLTGIPAISVPFAHENGLPIGMQIMGRQMHDRQVLQAAYALEQQATLPEMIL